MFEQENVEARTKMFESAMVVRCFMVGYRYFRQTEANRARLMNGMVHHLKVVYNVPNLAVDFHINNIERTLKLFAQQVSSTPDSWVAAVLFMASPKMFKRGFIGANEDVYPYWETMVRSVDFALVDETVVRIAVQGNPKLSEIFNMLSVNILPVYDEDALPGAKEEIPVLPNNLIRDAFIGLTYRRQLQLP